MGQQIYYWNCASGLLNKMSAIDVILSECSPIAFFAAESDLMGGRDLSIFNRQGYKLVHSKNLSVRGKARLSCWISDSFVHETNLEEYLNEIIVLKHKTTNFVVVGIYHPFKCYQGESIRSNFLRLIQNLNNICGAHKNILIVGDFNVQYDSSDPCPLKYILDGWSDAHELDQLVTGVTRSRLVRENLQKSMLDLVFTKIDGVTVEKSFNSLSDHVIVEINLGQQRFARPPAQTKRVSFLDWKKYSKFRIQTAFLKNFHGINGYVRDPNNINEKISTAICLSLNEIVPVRQCNIKGNNIVINSLIRLMVSTPMME